jgi:hypothetical protein
VERAAVCGPTEGPPPTAGALFDLSVPGAEIGHSGLRPPRRAAVFLYEKGLARFGRPYRSGERKTDMVIRTTGRRRLGRSLAVAVVFSALTLAPMSHGGALAATGGSPNVEVGHSWQNWFGALDTPIDPTAGPYGGGPGAGSEDFHDPQPCARLEPNPSNVSAKTLKPSSFEMILSGQVTINDITVNDVYDVMVTYVHDPNAVVYNGPNFMFGGSITDSTTGANTVFTTGPPAGCNLSTKSTATANQIPVKLEWIRDVDGGVDGEELLCVGGLGYLYRHDLALNMKFTDSVSCTATKGTSTLDSATSIEFDLNNVPLAPATSATQNNPVPLCDSTIKPAWCAVEGQVVFG